MYNDDVDVKASKRSFNDDIPQVRGNRGARRPGGRGRPRDDFEERPTRGFDRGGYHRGG